MSVQLLFIFDSCGILMVRINEYDQEMKRTEMFMSGWPPLGRRRVTVWLSIKHIQPIICRRDTEFKVNKQLLR